MSEEKLLGQAQRLIAVDRQKISELERKVALLEAFVKTVDAEGDAWMDIEGDGSPDWDWHEVWLVKASELWDARVALDWVPR